MRNNKYPQKRKSPPPFTQMAKLNMSKALKGHLVSEKTKQKIREALLGKPRPDFRGENASNWRGGITPLRILIRKCFKYRQWQSDILQRDNFTCQLCFIRGGKLATDHFPKSFSQILKEYEIKTFDGAIDCEELWNLNNGRTLCRECHLKTDNYGSKACTRK